MSSVGKKLTLPRHCYDEKVGIGEEERETKLVVVEELRIAVRAPKAGTHTGSEIATDSDDGSLRASGLDGHRPLSRLEEAV